MKSKGKRKRELKREKPSEEYLLCLLNGGALLLEKRDPSTAERGGNFIGGVEGGASGERTVETWLKKGGGGLKRNTPGKEKRNVCKKGKMNGFSKSALGGKSY